METSEMLESMCVCVYLCEKMVFMMKKEIRKMILYEAVLLYWEAETPFGEAMSMFLLK